MELTLDQALQKGVEAHKAGQVQEADRYYTAILKANPEHPDANHNMGVLAVGVGKVEESLPFFKAAIDTNANIEQFWLSYIDAFIKLERIAEAKAVLDQAKSKGVNGERFDQLENRISVAEKTLAVNNSNSPEPPQDRVKILIDLYSKDQLQEALNQASHLLLDYPQSVTLYNIVGAANQGLGNLAEAITAYKKAISIKPDYVDAYNNMGVVLKDQDKLDDAIQAYQKAISIKPDFAEAYNNMGVALKNNGKLDDAIKAHNTTLSLKPGHPSALHNMGNVLKSIVFNEPNRELQQTIIAILDKKIYVRPKDIAKAAISLLKAEPSLQKHLNCLSSADVTQSTMDVALGLSKFPLLLKLMNVCPLPDLDLEQALFSIRSYILLNILDMKNASPELLKFQSSLALQCFTNEYVYDCTEKDTEALLNLEELIENTLSSGNQPNPQDILCLASFKALHEYDWSHKLQINPDIEEVFIRQIREPAEEEQLKHKITVLNEITDDVSTKVRKQYEENPYPRWVNLGLSYQPMKILELVDKIKIKLQNRDIIDINSPDILVAGCGTGQHPIETASRFKDSKVLAVDLSLSSLAYAKRKTQEFNIKNIEYMQADILDLGKLKKQFDIIESAGVLHHMDDPMAGWKVLTDCLKPGGLMRIGLYSELARQSVVKIKDEINQLGIGSSDAEMKFFRNIIIKSDKDYHKHMGIRLDFYSLSTLKDLLFHVQEHRFTILRIKDCLAELGLEFCGFESEQNVHAFSKLNSKKDAVYNLDKWQTFEEANPTAFTGMYQFWCQKVE